MGIVFPIFEWSGRKGSSDIIADFFFYFFLLRDCKRDKLFELFEQLMMRSINLEKSTSKMDNSRTLSGAAKRKLRKEKEARQADIVNQVPRISSFF